MKLPPVYFPFTDYQNQIRFFKYNFWTTGPEVPFRKFLDFCFSSPTPASFVAFFWKHTIMNYSIVLSWMAIPWKEYLEYLWIKRIKDLNFTAVIWKKIAAYYHIPASEIPGIIKFGANVNPLGLSESVKNDLAGHLDIISSYPDRNYTSLKKLSENTVTFPLNILL